MLARALALSAALFCASAAPPPCGNATRALSATQKNVLLVGDSISMTPPYTPGGYGGALEKLLTARGVSVQHAGGDYSGGQCADTRNGLRCSNASAPSWLAFDGTFDVIHFNFGLHDVANCGVEAAARAFSRAL